MNPHAQLQGSSWSPRSAQSRCWPCRPWRLPRTATTTASRTAGRSATTSRCTVNQAGRDQDRDHLRNRAEFMAGDNPRSADSDGRRHRHDGQENAGTIQSFDPSTGKLTIALFGDETVSGLVTDRNPRSSARTSTHRHRPLRLRRRRAWDDRAASGEEPGDDHGGTAKKPGTTTATATSPAPATPAPDAARAATRTTAPAPTAPPPT